MAGISLWAALRVLPRALEYHGCTCAASCWGHGGLVQAAGHGEAGVMSVLSDEVEDS